MDRQVRLASRRKLGVAIRKAIKISSFFVALLSKKSVGKRGFVQKELREALKVAEEFPQDEVFIIPVRIDECDPPNEDLQALQRVDLFPSYYDGFRTLRQALMSEYEQEYGGAERQGKISKIDRQRSYGFIKDDESDKNVFFLFKDFISLNLPFIEDGMYVRYQNKAGPMGPTAMEITFT